MFKVERTIHSHYSNRFSSTHRFSQLEPKQRFEISTHPNWYLPKKKTLTSSYLKCVCLIYRFSTEKRPFSEPPKMSWGWSKGYSWPHYSARPKRFESRGSSAKANWARGPGKTQYRAGNQGPVVRRPISAWPRVRFNPGFFFFCSKTFSWIIFSVIFKSIQSSTCWQKELNWIYFSSFHLGYLNPALNNPAQMACGWGPTRGMIINRKKNWQFITQIKLHTHLLNL